VDASAPRARAAPGERCTERRAPEAAAVGVTAEETETAGAIAQVAAAEQAAEGAQVVVAAQALEAAAEGAQVVVAAQALEAAAASGPGRGPAPEWAPGPATARW
jgi:hypothetical protein